MLFCTSLLALVGAADQPQSSPRKLQIVNTKVGESNRRVIVLSCYRCAYASTARLDHLRVTLPKLDTRRQDE